MSEYRRDDDEAVTTAPACPACRPRAAAATATACGPSAAVPANAGVARPAARAAAEDERRPRFVPAPPLFDPAAPPEIFGTGLPGYGTPGEVGGGHSSATSATRQRHARPAECDACPNRTSLRPARNARRTGNADVMAERCKRAGSRGGDNSPCGQAHQPQCQFRCRQSGRGRTGNGVCGRRVWQNSDAAVIARRAGGLACPRLNVDHIRQKGCEDQGVHQTPGASTPAAATSRRPARACKAVAPRPTSPDQDHLQQPRASWNDIRKPPVATARGPGKSACMRFPWRGERGSSVIAPGGSHNISTGNRRAQGDVDLVPRRKRNVHRHGKTGNRRDFAVGRGRKPEFGE